MSKFDEYIFHGEPEQKDKPDTWQKVSVLKKASSCNKFR